ncbi:EKC/KEOPS complex subunit [Escovopsis weberi]|uniref:EKC/KEOPS complex subunit CGI121 n=1 Tax=Escovopsis weberi TaxID=150374 RepID=A0A0M9VSX4_ESCWE|nr:EKC/KEOPS complex subunit [Escovopsis weberi]
MTPLESLTLEHVPAHYAVHVCLFQDVQNPAFLHQQLLARNPDFEYAFIDAAAILSRIHLLSAIFKAINTHHTGSLRTPNIHSETVVSLSPSSNIAEAYRRFGISQSTKSLIAIKISALSDADSGAEAVEDRIWSHLGTHVAGTPAPLTDANISLVSNLQTIRKNYKLNGLNWIEAIGDESRKKSETEKLIVAALALRGI